MTVIEEHGDWLIWHDPLPVDWRGADWHYARKVIGPFSRSGPSDAISALLRVARTIVPLTPEIAPGVQPAPKYTPFCRSLSPLVAGRRCDGENDEQNERRTVFNPVALIETEHRQDSAHCGRPALRW